MDKFTEAVIEIVAAIPKGMVATYGDVAALAGEPTHARQVGKILGAVGMESPTPCHRVVNAQGRPAPHWLEQRPKLEAEGVAFKANGNVDLARHRWHPELDFPEL